jgi:antitoxin MazE
VETRVQRWGNSLAVRIPKPVARQLGLVEGGEVALEVREGALEVRPLGARYRLAELVSEIREGNLHDEAEWGAPRGREAW